MPRPRAAERQGATAGRGIGAAPAGRRRAPPGPGSDEASRFFEEARALYAAAGDRAGVARALNNLASAISDGPDTRRIKALYEEGLAIARAVGEQNLVARFLNNMAIQERRAGNLQASLRMNQESLAIRREIGDRVNGAVSLNNIGNVLLDMGDLSAASEHYEQSAAAAARSAIGAVWRARSTTRPKRFGFRANLARARATGREALEIRRGIDDPASVATSLFGVGVTAAQEGDLAARRASAHRGSRDGSQAEPPAADGLRALLPGRDCAGAG